MLHYCYSPRCFHTHHHYCCLSPCRCYSPLHFSPKRETIKKEEDNINLQTENIIKSTNYKSYKNTYESPNRKEEIVSSSLSLRLSPKRRFSPVKSCLVCHCAPCCCCSLCHCHPCCCHCSPVHSPERTSPLRSSMKNTYTNEIQTNYAPIKFNPNEYEENQLKEFLIEVMKSESKIEDAKIDLAMKPDFNCEDAFRIFEYNGRGFITPEDLRYGLNLLDIYVTDSDINLLMKRFDLLKDGYLNYENFFDMVVPFEKQCRDMVEIREPNSCCACRCPEIFSFSTRYALKSLFNLIIEEENKLNLMKRRFTTLRIKLPSIFKLFDTIGIGKFYESDLNRYFIDNGVSVSDKDRNLLYIRLDTDRDGSIDYDEVEDELKSIY